MTEGEFKQTKALIDRITEHEKRLQALALDAEDPFISTLNGIVDLLAVGKKRLSDRIEGEHPPLNQ